MEEWKKNALKDQESKIIKLEESYNILEKENDDLKLVVAKSDKCSNVEIDLQKSNELLEKENEKLKQHVESLDSKLTILQNVAVDVMGPENNVVVINNDTDQRVCLECSKHKRKADNLLKEKCIMNDQGLELKEKFSKLDQSYKSVIEAKDKTISECMEIREGSDEIEVKFQRLLLHYKAENELKNMQMIKEIIAGNKDDEMEKEDEASNVEASLKSDTMSEINVEDKASNINTANNDE